RRWSPAPDQSDAPAGHTSPADRQAGDTADAGEGGDVLVATERLPELMALHPLLVSEPVVVIPKSREARAWTRASALIELLRSRLTITGPTTAAALAQSLAVPESDAQDACLALESEGVVLRGSFTGARRHGSHGSGVRDQESGEGDQGLGIR